MWASYFSIVQVPLARGQYPRGFLFLKLRNSPLEIKYDAVRYCPRGGPLYGTNIFLNILWLLLGGWIICISLVLGMLKKEKKFEMRNVKFEKFETSRRTRIFISF